MTGNTSRKQCQSVLCTVQLTVLMMIRICIDLVEINSFECVHCCLYEKEDGRSSWMGVKMRMKMKGNENENENGKKAIDREERGS